MFISVLVVRAILNEIELRGLDRDTLLDEAGLERHLLLDARAKVSFGAWDRLVGLAMQRLRDPGLALTIGSEHSEGMLQLLGFMQASSRTLKEAFELSQRFLPLVVNGLHMELVHVGPRTHFRFACYRGMSEDTLRFGEELVAVLAFRVGKQHVPNLRADFRFRHAEPSYRSRLEAHFGRNLRFDCEHSEIVFERHVLERDQPYGDPRVLDVLVEAADKQLREQAESPSMAERVRWVLSHSVSLHSIGAKEVAAELRVGERALQRLLSAEGASFRGLLDEARMNAACQLLLLPQKSITEVSYELGYSEPSAFHRAFKRWTCATPADYIRAHAGRAAPPPRAGVPGPRGRPSASLA